MFTYMHIKETNWKNKKKAILSIILIPITIIADIVSIGFEVACGIVRLLYYVKRSDINE